MTVFDNEGGIRMMYMHFTVGTRDFLETLRIQNEDYMISFGAGETILMHETNGGSQFATPRSYQVIDQVGTLNEVGYFVLNHIPVTDQGRPIFEHRFMNRESQLQDFAGFVAFRLLRPIHGDTYVVLTEWTDRKYFQMWKESNSFQKAHAENKQRTSGPHIFSSASYKKTYHTRKEDIADMIKRK